MVVTWKVFEITDTINVPNSFGGNTGSTPVIFKGYIGLDADNNVIKMCDYNNVGVDLVNRSYIGSGIPYFTNNNVWGGFSCNLPFDNLFGAKVWNIGAGLMYITYDGIYRDRDGFSRLQGLSYGMPTTLLSEPIHKIPPTPYDYTLGGGIFWASMTITLGGNNKFSGFCSVYGKGNPGNGPVTGIYSNDNPYVNIVRNTTDPYNVYNTGPWGNIDFTFIGLYSIPGMDYLFPNRKKYVIKGGMGPVGGPQIAVFDNSNNSSDAMSNPALGGQLIFGSAPIQYPPVPFSNICFPIDTPVNTNQGIIPIQKINPKIHTIRNRKIVAITRNISQDEHLVCFEENSISNRVPNNRTLITKNHLVFHKGFMVKASSLVNDETITLVPYNGEVLFNVLMEQHDKMVVNNLICETLHPDNAIAKLFLYYQTLSLEEQIESTKFWNNTCLKYDLINSENTLPKDLIETV